MTKTILITGGGRGIGRSAAILAGARGWSVAVNYIGNAEAAEETAEAVRTAGGRAAVIRGDVSLEADVIGMFDAGESAFGAIDGVVINAGIVAPASKLADMSVERMKRVFDVNVLGAYLCAREAARRLGKTRKGNGSSIVLLSSMAARLGAPNEYIDYAGSKGAIDTLTIGLAKELGPEGIRVNAIRPGLIDTEIHLTSGAPDRAARLGVATPLGRAGRPEEIGEAILWLLSDAASYVTGSILDIAGGR